MSILLYCMLDVWMGLGSWVHWMRKEDIQWQNVIYYYFYIVTVEATQNILDSGSICRRVHGTAVVSQYGTFQNIYTYFELLVLCIGK